MGTGCGLHGWTDGRTRQPQAASGELQAGIEARAAAGPWPMRTNRRARGYKQGWADGRAGKPTAQIEPKSCIARFWHVERRNTIYMASFCKNLHYLVATLIPRKNLCKIMYGHMLSCHQRDKSFSVSLHPFHPSPAGTNIGSHMMVPYIRTISQNYQHFAHVAQWSKHLGAMCSRT